MKTSIKIPWLFVPLLPVVIFIAISSHYSYAQNFKVGTWKTAQTIQPFYYHKYMKASQKVSLYYFTNPSDQKMAVLAGSLDMCGTTISHAIHSASRGEPVVVVAALCNKCSALVVNNNSQIKTVTDLKGKKIGYVPGTMHEILLRETLSQNSISAGRDVQLMRVDFFDMGMALARGSIDAFLSGEPFPTLAVSRGYGAILSYPYFGESIGTINAGMLVHKESIENNPDHIFQLVLAHAQATEYLKAHPDKWLTEASKFSTPHEILKKSVHNMELTWEINESYVDKARILGKRMYDLGRIEREPDYDKLFNLSFVKKVNCYFNNKSYVSE